MTDMRFEHRMRDADALMWTVESDPSLRSTITSVALLDGGPAAIPDPERSATCLDDGFAEVVAVA